jgi:hypothetical protein
MVSPFLVKALIEGRWSQRTPGNKATELGSPKESIRMTEYLAPVKDGFVEVPSTRGGEEIGFLLLFQDGEAVPSCLFNPCGEFWYVVGVSKPCQSERFHLEGDEIRLRPLPHRWDLETLRG